MKRFLIAFATAALFAIFIFSCENREAKQERLARQYCSSCHLFTPPELLTKKIWNESVLPQMAFRMGLSEMNVMSSFTPEDLQVILPRLPAKPMVSEEEWMAIKDYFISHAPDSVPAAAHRATAPLTLFDITPVRHGGINAMVTMIETDTLQKKTWLGTRTLKLYRMNDALTIEDSIRTSSPVSDILFQNNQSPVVAAMGIMDPNDQSRGSLQNVSPVDEASRVLIDSLKRPVYFEKADLNGDHLDDYIVCEFGNFTGALVVYENRDHNRFKKHVVLNQPGARKLILKDIDNDGLKDIIVLMTQGDEQISLLQNYGHFDFKIKSLLRFMPVYGSSFFDIADFNHDGHFDILYTNGDNADYSAMLKSFHGVHLYLNDGENHFKESWFYPMNGASQAYARDFDHDGDLDIAAISFFPDFNYPEEGFIYLENKGNEFVAQTTPLSASARWLVMNVTDLDSDGDDDIVLGAMNFGYGAPRSLFFQWQAHTVSLLILRNKTAKSR